MANGQDNLRPFNELTEDEQREIAKMGGKASGEARAKRKTLKEELLLLLSQGNTQEKISISLITEALNGNIKAFEVIRDTVGEKPVDKLEADVGVTTINVKLDDDE